MLPATNRRGSPDQAAPPALRIKRLARRRGRSLAVVRRPGGPRPRRPWRGWTRRPRPCGVITWACWCSRRCWSPWRKWRRRQGALFKQWLASLLVGAMNIEQTKFLSWPDLSRLLGSVVRFPYPQRQELERVATPANIEALARFNAQQIGAEAHKPVLFRPPYQALHRTRERAGRVVSGDPLGGQSHAQRFYPHGGRRAALL